MHFLPQTDSKRNEAEKRINNKTWIKTQEKLICLSKSQDNPCRRDVVLDAVVIANHVNISK